MLSSKEVEALELAGSAPASAVELATEARVQAMERGLEKEGSGAAGPAIGPSQEG